MKILCLSILLFVLGCAPEYSNIAEAEESSKATTQKAVYALQIKDLAASSTCAKTSWTNRGKGPAGYFKGMALSYARSLCRVKSSVEKPSSKIFKSASSGVATKDVLAHYQDILAVLGIRVTAAGEEPLHATYTIGYGLGMRESSGKYCEGWDTSAGSDRLSAAAEAGLFQASYDSISKSTELRKLYDEYKASPSRCLLDVYKEGASCKANTILGTGAGADFQVFAKACPAFATEYAMTLIRILRTHFGPLNRKEAQVVPACDALLTGVAKIVNSDPDVVCKELF